MSQQVDLYKLILGMRHELLGAEIVRLSGTNELIGIRADDYNPSYHVRPVSGYRTPIVSGTPQQLNDNMSVYNPDDIGLSMFVTETYLPSFGGRIANDRSMSEGIMQYDVNVKSAIAGGVTDMAQLWNTTKYIQEVFDPELDPIQTNQYLNTGIDIDEITPGPQIIDDGWVKIPLSISCRSYIDAAAAPISGTVDPPYVPIALILDPGEHIVDSFVTSSFQGVRWDYSVLRTTNARTGSILAAWDTSNVDYNEVSTPDVGDTDSISFRVENNTGVIELIAIVTTGTYSLRLNRYQI